MPAQGRHRWRHRVEIHGAFALRVGILLLAASAAIMFFGALDHPGLAKWPLLAAASGFHAHWPMALPLLLSGSAMLGVGIGWLVVKLVSLSASQSPCARD